MDYCVIVKDKCIVVTKCSSIQDAIQAVEREYPGICGGSYPVIIHRVGDRFPAKYSIDEGE